MAKIPDRLFFSFTVAFAVVAMRGKKEQKATHKEQTIALTWNKTNIIKIKPPENQIFS